MPENVPLTVVGDFNTGGGLAQLDQWMTADELV